MKIEINIDEANKRILDYKLPPQIHLLDCIQIMNSVQNSIMMGIRQLEETLKEQDKKIKIASLYDIKNVGKKNECV